MKHDQHAREPTPCTLSCPKPRSRKTLAGLPLKNKHRTWLRAVLHPLESFVAALVPQKPGHGRENLVSLKGFGCIEMCRMRHGPRNLERRGHQGHQFGLGPVEG
jgi:hypothetical protein